jgi:hypothetical protein
LGIRSSEINKRLASANKASIAKVVLLLLLSVVCRNAAAQTWPFELWHDGKVVLLQGDTLKGLVKYDLSQDLVQVAAGDGKNADAFTARKVLFFEIYDASISRYRQFYTLPFATVGGYKAPVFFELLSEGKMTLLAREFLESKTVTSPYYFGSYSQIVLSHHYFFLKEDGAIDEFTGSRNDFLDLFDKKSKDVEKYIKTNRLKFGEKDDMTKIVSYYNSLFEI